MQTYAQRQLSFQLERLADKMLKHDNRKPKRKNSKDFGTTGRLVPLCNCDVLPWEDCPHTVSDEDALKQIRAHC